MFINAPTYGSLGLRFVFPGDLACIFNSYLKTTKGIFIMT